MTWIACVSIVCGTSLIAWILWLRTLPVLSRKEADAMIASLKTQKDRLDKVQQALALRGTG